MRRHGNRVNGLDLAPKKQDKTEGWKLDNAELSVLGLGLNYNLTPEPDSKRIACAVESAVMCVEPHRRDEARTRVVGVLSKLQRRRKVDPLLPEERRALKKLCDNERIVILPADKGNATVVLNKLDYEKKMLRMLEDKETYKPLNRDPTPKTQRDLQKLLADTQQISAARKGSLKFVGLDDCAALQQPDQASSYDVVVVNRHFTMPYVTGATAALNKYAHCGRINSPPPTMGLLYSSGSSTQRDSPTAAAQRALRRGGKESSSPMRGGAL
ncbi:hypothetical protein HPB50_022271 [Hyalomma asiaticum]|uniref:Uncharacterized protein n=1 Tax=Hyalomma asiaticum TaxID=266040 RepID=A0ACB7S7F6_HYAAI|nr:hypothetical protein HPB50_022271 [Hyalomma asiaticum]